MHVSCAIGHTTFGISSKQGDRNISFSKLFLQSLPGVKDIMRWNGTICCSTLTLSLVIFMHGKLLPQKFWDRTKWIYEKYLPIAAVECLCQHWSIWKWSDIGPRQTIKLTSALVFFMTKKGFKLHVFFTRVAFMLKNREAPSWAPVKWRKQMKKRDIWAQKIRKSSKK